MYIPSFHSHFYNKSKQSTTRDEPGLLEPKVVRSLHRCEVTELAKHTPLLSNLGKRQESSASQSPWLWYFGTRQEECLYTNLTPRDVCLLGCMVQQ